MNYNTSKFKQGRLISPQGDSKQEASKRLHQSFSITVCPYSIPTILSWLRSGIRVNHRDGKLRDESLGVVFITVLPVQIWRVGGRCLSVPATIDPWAAGIPNQSCGRNRAGRGI